MDQAEKQNPSARVLIVEDNVNQLRTLVDIVELEGFPVAACSTATEALALAQRERFGIVIMDLRLPDGDGVYLLEQLRAFDSNQRIIINTGFASLGSAKEAVNLGAFAYIEKASNPEELVRHVHRAHAVYLSSYAKELEFAVAERTAALHRSESDYRILMEQSADGIFIADGRGNFTLVNAQAGCMLGYTRDELERMNVRELVAPEILFNIDPWLEELRRGAALSIECPLRCKDGSKKIMEVRACMLSDGRIQSNLRDITERKRLEEELRESEELFRTVAETSQAGILILEGEKIVSCNPALQSRSGYSQEELLTMPFWQLAAPEFREQLQLLNVALQRGNEIPINYELKVITKSGEERWIQGSIGRLSFHGRQAVLAVTMDITERKTAEAALRESEALFRTLAETSEAGILISQGAKILYANPALSRQNGYSREEMSTMESWAPLAPEFRERAIRRMRARQRGERVEIPTQEEVRVITKSGAEQWVRMYRASVTFQGAPAFMSVIVDVTERRRMEEELRASEARYRLLFENAVEGIFRSTPAGRFEVVNPALVQMLGYASAEEVCALHLPTELYAEPGWREQLKALLEGKGVVSGAELTWKKKNGEFITVHLYARALCDADGRVFSYEGSVFDVTARVQAERALRESELLFRTLAETSQAGIFIVQGERFMYVNPALEQIGGFTRQEYLTMPFWQAVSPEFREEIQRYGLARQRGEHVPSYYELKVSTKHGEERWVHTTMATIQHQGNPAGLGVVLDITDRRKMEDELRASEARFRVTFEQAAVGMAHVNLDGRFFLVNQKLCDILGYTANELYQMFCDDVTHPNDRGAIMRETQRIMAGEISSFVVEKRCLHKNGTVVWVTLTSALVRGAHHEPLYFVDVIEDISVRKQIEAEQQRLVAILENTTDFIVTTTVDGRGVYMNRAGRALMGLSAGADIRAWDSRIAYTPQSLEMVVSQAIPTALQTGAWAGEAVALNSSGEEIPISQVIVAHKEEHGRVQYLSVMARDISEQKRAEAVLQALPRELLAVQEHERRHIARELHDEIGQVLTAITINLQTIQRAPEVFTERIEESIHLVENALQQVRTLSLDLRPPMLDDLGLVAALRWHLDQRAQRSGFSIQFDADSLNIAPPQEVAIVCFRIVQEALTNIVRHAHAQKVRVELRQDRAALQLRIWNDGETFDVEKARARARRGESTGLVGMQERAHMVGGRVDIVSREGKGTEVSVWLPLSITEAPSVMRNGK